MLITLPNLPRFIWIQFENCEKFLDDLNSTLVHPWLWYKQDNKNNIKLKRFKQVKVKLKLITPKSLPAERGTLQGDHFDNEGHSSKLGCASSLRTIITSVERAHERVHINNIKRLCFNEYGDPYFYCTILCTILFCLSESEEKCSEDIVKSEHKNRYSRMQIMTLYRLKWGNIYTSSVIFVTLRQHISPRFGRAMVRILARCSRVKIPMTRPNMPDIPPKRTKTGTIMYLMHPNSNIVDIRTVDTASDCRNNCECGNGKALSRAARPIFVTSFFQCLVRNKLGEIIIQLGLNWIIGQLKNHWATFISGEPAHHCQVRTESISAYTKPAENDLHQALHRHLYHVWSTKQYSLQLGVSI